MSDTAAETLVSVAKELLKVLEPLRDGFSSVESFQSLLYTLGFEVTGIPNEYIDAGAEVAAGVDVVQEMATGPFELSQVAELLGHAVRVYGKLDPLPALPPGMDPATVLGEVGKNLSDLLICNYLASNWPEIYALLSAMEVIVVENLGDTATRKGFVRRVFRWEEIPKLLQDPHLILQRVYGWGTDTLDMEMICYHLGTFMNGIGFPVSTEREKSLVGVYSAGPFENLPGLKWPFYYTTVANAPIELSFLLLPLPAQDGHKPGLVIQPGIPSVLPFEFDLADDVTLKITAGSDIAQQFGLLIRPDGLGVRYPFQDASTIPSVTFGVAVSVDRAEPAIIFGSKGGIRLQTKGFEAGILATGQVTDLEVKLSMEVKELALVIAASDGDGFLHTLLGDSETTVAIPLGIDWSSKHGFGFRGSLNFEVALHPHLKLGPIEIPDLSLSLAVPADADPKARVQAAITLKAALGPLNAVVEEMGIQLDARFTPGNLGPMDLGVGFKPPNGVGLSLDAGAVRGGGYLFFDFDRGEYAGVMQLNVLDMISITAIGLITTKMPDGSPGFSLLVIITVEFSPGIQLGYGFSLIGLGGLLGLNRTLMPEPLMVGVRNGTVNAIMFPQGDIIANAPRIISDLRAIFPPYQGRFLIGPMAKIGWGDALITVSLGVIIEIPGNIALIGVLRLALPDADDPVLILQVAFAGAIEFDKKRLFFFAAIYESRILFITIEGEMGFVLGWGDNPIFLFSVGGFHPRFTPPPLPFPSPVRVALAILDEENAMVRLETYFAVTSNTVQVGADVHLRFGYQSFGVEGHLGFDALFQFSPFYLLITADITLSLKVTGMDLLTVRVDLSLEGPTPWHAKGTGHVKLLFWDVHADFDETWGDVIDTVAAPIALLPKLIEELAKRDNWTAAVPVANNLMVSLRSLTEAPDEVILHPLGTLRVTQRLIPLDLNLDKLGAQRSTDARRLQLAVSSNALAKTVDTRESFAMAQFQDMSDSAKLSRPSFEPANGGLEMGASGAALATDHMARRVVRYEQIIIDSEYKRQQLLGLIGAGLFDLHLRGAAIARGRWSQAQSAKLDPFPADKIKVAADAHTVVDADTNLPYGAGATFTSAAEALDHMNALVQGDAGLAGRLQVVPAYEAAA